jgi:centromeric protein E
MDDRKVENITVGVRIRPLNSREITNGCTSIWLNPNLSTIKEKSGARSFVFDQVYPDYTESLDIFKEQCSSVIEKSISGYNGCIFCYGQTGSGKTHTMHGSLKQNPGLVPLSIDKIFSLIQNSSGKEFLIRCSYIELYNESINDLLNPASINLQLAEDRRVLFT